MSRKKKHTQLGMPAKPNFILRTSSEDLDMEMMEPFIEDDNMDRMRWVADNMFKLRKRATVPEITVAKYLWKERVIYITQAPFRIFSPDRGFNCYFADFYIPALALIIELDGSQHSQAEWIVYDRNRDVDFASLGIKTIRIKNADVYSGRYKAQIPIPPEEDLKPMTVTYLREGDSAITRAKKEEVVKRLLRYKE